MTGTTPRYAVQRPTGSISTGRCREPSAPQVKKLIAESVTAKARELVRGLSD
ncbi:hypothetical protein FTUN_4219 [Frigoriglobus tundricola]|uniref:Uncharacterized protein n=1 Tax=Frigoriglobus tundricola TaxID=2774151 RepID=A0A6M5YUV6_9BACT|nr:hypothetical protein FTUN_4219 [Frigoriglobus tundricola]